MEYLYVIILGVIQGLTEFLPVSSSGHLILAPLLFGFEDQGLGLDAILHLATLLAILFFFKKPLLKLATSLFDGKSDPASRRVTWSILLACFPAGIVGLFWENLIETRFRDPNLVAVNLLVWSFVFLAADRLAAKRKKSISQIEDIRPSQIIFIGFAQALALIPGTSRSGITIAAGLFCGLSQKISTTFSFLLGTPIIFAAGVHKAMVFFTTTSSSIAFSITQILVGFAVTFVLGYFSIKLLFRIITQAGLLPFIAYRIALATFLLFFFNW